MLFRAIVVVLLALIIYGVLYRNLPCWAQTFGKTFYCEIVAESQQFRKTHGGKGSEQVEVEGQLEILKRRPKPELPFLPLPPPRDVFPPLDVFDEAPTEQSPRKL